jgi:hypothetical protein
VAALCTSYCYVKIGFIKKTKYIIRCSMESSTIHKGKLILIAYLLFSNNAKFCAISFRRCKKIIFSTRVIYLALKIAYIEFHFFGKKKYAIKISFTLWIVELFMLHLMVYVSALNILSKNFSSTRCIFRIILIDTKKIHHFLF